MLEWAISAVSRRPVAIALAGMPAMAAAVGVGRFVLAPILPFMEQGLGLAKPDSRLIGPAFAGFAHGIADSFVLPSPAASAARMLGAWLAWPARGP